MERSAAGPLRKADLGVVAPVTLLSTVLMFLILFVKISAIKIPGGNQSLAIKVIA